MSARARPKLFTFDLFGTVIDWRSGLRAACATIGRSLSDDEFDRVIDFQGQLESAGPFLPYREIVAESLVQVLDLPRAASEKIGLEAGTWPLYQDSKSAMKELIEIAPCIAMTNSDRCHKDQIEAQLGFSMSSWFCAEDVRIYKPAREFWDRVSADLRIGYSTDWWHVSAYGDYDLEMVSRLGLTGVFVERPHSRIGPSDLRICCLTDLIAEFSI